MAWDPDNPFPAPAALGETDSGARNLPAFLCSLLQPGPVLALGASEVVLEAALAHDVTVLDWSRRRLLLLEDSARSRGQEIRVVCRDPERQELGLAPRSVRNAVCLEVLESFRDDVAILEKLRRVLEPEGRLVVRVRACPWVHEHGGRAPLPASFYDPEGLREILEEAGFRPLMLRHWNLLGLPAMFVRERLLRRLGRGRGAASAGAGPSRHWWDEALDAWFRGVENRVGFPLGLSLVAVATPLLEKARVPQDLAEKGLAGRAARATCTPAPTAK